MGPAPCPSCGKPTGGKFCRHCGVALGADQCGRCGNALAPGARFCAQCGNSATATATAEGTRAPLLWFLAGGVTVAVVGGLVLGLNRGGGGAAAAPVPLAAGADAAAVTDISNMTPRERFDRLYNRIMRASESGDETTVTTFAPMALSAYGMLEEIDADARYHAALIRLHTGDMAGARALADTILKNQRSHLFGIIVQGTIARFEKDQAALARSYADFLKHYDAEIAAKRPEYSEHPRSLEDFLAAARAASGGGTP